MDILLVDARILHGFLNGRHGVPEVIHAELLEPRPGESAAVIDPVEEGVDLDRGLRRGGERALRPLTLSAQTTDRTLVPGEVLPAVLALEVLATEVHDAIVK